MAESYHATLAREALSKTVTDYVGDSTPGTVIRLVAALLALAFMFLWVQQIDPKSSAFNDAVLAAAISGGVFVSVFVFGLVMNLLFLVPPRLWGRQRAKIRDLTQALTPRIRFEIDNDGRPRKFEDGTTTLTDSGDRLTNSKGHKRAICGLLVNDSSVSSSGTRVMITALEGDNDSKLVDPVYLRWHTSEFAGGFDTVPARSTRTIRLFDVTGTDVYFSSAESLNLEQTNFFFGGSRFEGKLALTDLEQGALVVSFVLVTDQTPRITIVGVESRDADE